MNPKKSSFDRGATNKRVNTHIVDEFQERALSLLFSFPEKAFTQP